MSNRHIIEAARKRFDAQLHTTEYKRIHADNEQSWCRRCWVSSTGLRLRVLAICVRPSTKGPRQQPGAGLRVFTRPTGRQTGCGHPRSRMAARRRCSLPSCTLTGSLADSHLLRRCLFSHTRSGQARQKGDLLTTVLYNPLYWAISKLFKRQFMELMGANGMIIASLTPNSAKFD